MQMNQNIPEFEQQPRRRAKRQMRLWPLILGLSLLLVAMGMVVALGSLFGGRPGAAGTGDAPPATPQAAAMNAGPPYIVALDAGHGGNDIGAEALIREVDMNERTVEALYALLEADANFTPVLCRPIGEGASIAERVEAAETQGAQLLLSIHGNSDPVYNSSGLECFPAPPGRTHHAESLRFATLLANEMIAAGSNFRGENGVRYLYYIEQADGSYEKMYREVSDTRTYEDKSFGIVEGAACPAVLAEQCYITNASDVQAFGTEEGCKKAAECYYRAICAYFGL